VFENQGHRSEFTITATAGRGDNGIAVAYISKKAWMQ